MNWDRLALGCLFISSSLTTYAAQISGEPIIILSAIFHWMGFIVGVYLVRKFERRYGK